MRYNIIKNLNIDIICITETHLKLNSIIDVDCFSWFGNNGSVNHIRANKAYGGIGWLVKDSIFNNYLVKVHDKSYEGILVLNLKNINTNFSMTLIGCYLPPDNSIWGRDAAAFLSHLIALLYMTSNDDLVVLCGDFNARLGNFNDFIHGVDNIKERKVIDVKHNKHGESLMEFLKDSNCCVMNGRFHENLDNFTYISTRGKSVIDYFICPHEHLKLCTNFEVKTVSDVIDKFLLHGLLNSKCKMSDHSIMVVNITTSYGRILHDNTLMDKDIQGGQKKTIPKVCLIYIIN